MGAALRARWGCPGPAEAGQGAMQAVCAKCSRLMCRAVVLFLVAECAQTTPMIAPLPGDPNFSIDGSVAFFKSGESNPTQPNPCSAAQQLAARSSQRSAAARSAAQRQRRVREGRAGTGTPTSTSSFGQPTTPHSQLQQLPPQPPAYQHRPHSQSSATSPTSTTTPGPLRREHRW